MPELADRVSWPTGTFLHRLPEPARRALFAAGTSIVVRNGTKVVAQGDPSRDVYLLVQGQVEVGLVDHLGHSMEVEIRNRGDLFGELEAIEPAPRSATVTAIGNVTLRVLTCQRFIALLDDNRAVERELLRSTVQRLLAMNSVRTDVHLSVDVRLCRQLIRYLDKPYGRTRTDGTLEITGQSQSSLAGNIGASVAAVEKAISKLRRDGVISTANRRITIIKPQALSKKAQMEPSTCTIGTVLGDD
jgi:CRP-like cAMP-binding protein